MQLKLILPLVHLCISIEHYYLQDKPGYPDALDRGGVFFPLKVRFTGGCCIVASFDLFCSRNPPPPSNMVHHSSDVFLAHG